MANPKPPGGNARRYPTHVLQPATSLTVTLPACDKERTQREATYWVNFQVGGCAPSPASTITTALSLAQPQRSAVDPGHTCACPAMFQCCPCWVRPSPSHSSALGRCDAGERDVSPTDGAGLLGAHRFRRNPAGLLVTALVSADEQRKSGDNDPPACQEDGEVMGEGRWGRCRGMR